MNNPEPITPPEGDDTTLRAEIYALPYAQTRKNLLKLLDARGVTGVQAFLDKVAYAMRDRDDLDLRTDPSISPELRFDAFEQRLFFPGLLSLTRRDLLGGLAWGVTGAALGAHGALGVASQFSEEDCSLVPKNRYQRMCAAVFPTVEAVVGAACMTRGATRHIAKELDRTAEALEEMYFQQERNRNGAAR